MDSKIIIGSDHGGFALKKKIITFLQNKGYEVFDVGTYSKEPCDYPDIACKVAENVSHGSYSRGIVICKTGIGVSICANKSKGVRAALCTSVEQAALSRKHNNSNILALGTKFTPLPIALKICETWLTTKFDGGRHERRINKISQFENN